ncbi:MULTISPECIES: hypothetical protein [unclassified Clostridium]|uniref:hypothetical protein n=1 Tax=unclassified Clostridium TaxID=2614128 RepID=UPI0018986853|nr:MULTISPECIES: hypothetical protein [unclassified Clostridium]MCR1952268.1 hypothetical protein [Clostridium sp. DSM 100503]
MRGSTIVIILGSIGFILMGFLSLKSKKMKNFLKDSGVYSDIEKFMKLNGIFNISIGFAGIILGALDYIFIEQSKYIVIIFILTIAIASFVQNKMLKKYRNI